MAIPTTGLAFKHDSLLQFLHAARMALRLRRTPVSAYSPVTMENILAVAGTNSKYKVLGNDSAGFWAGLWHGMIAPITFIVSLFIDGVSIYETHNNGRWYEFGFMLGIGAYAGGDGARRAAGG